MNTPAPQADVRKIPESAPGPEGWQEYLEEIVDYYSEAGPDYAAWSPGFQMHFGYWRRGLNPFRRELMLEEANRQIFARLAPKLESGARVLDAGCGLGAPARALVAARADLEVIGLSITPWQITEARRKSRDLPLQQRERLEFVQGDYNALPHNRFGDASLDAAYCLESACYAPGLAKRSLIQEMARVLKRGGRLVVVDGFYKRGVPRGPVLGPIARGVCANWSLECFAGVTEFTQALEENGFHNIRVEDFSWRIAPSALHIPYVTLKFFFEELIRKRGRLTRQRWKNALAPILGLMLGLARRSFGYYCITADRA